MTTEIGLFDQKLNKYVFPLLSEYEETDSKFVKYEKYRKYGDLTPYSLTESTADLF